MSRPSFTRVFSDFLPAFVAVVIGSALGLIPYTVAAFSHPDYRLLALTEPTAAAAFVLSAVLGIILYDFALHRLIYRPMCRWIKKVIVTPWMNRRASAAKEPSVWSRVLKQ